MMTITVSVKPEDKEKVSKLIRFDNLNFSAFDRSKIRERYKEFIDRGGE